MGNDYIILLSIIRFVSSNSNLSREKLNLYRM